MGGIVNGAKLQSSLETGGVAYDLKLQIVKLSV